MKKSLLLSLAPVAVVCVAAMGMSSAAADSTNYQATLKPLNNSTGSGTLKLSLSGNQATPTEQVATVTQQVSGLADKYVGAPYPHVQHIHGGAKGICPTTAADKNGDGVISLTEGGPSYGSVLTTLHKLGDTSPASGMKIQAAPGGASYSYSRSIRLTAAAVTAIRSGTAVIVVSGLDPSTLPKQAQAAKSDLVPSLPLALTSPALCGKLTSVASGAVKADGGSTSGLKDGSLIALSGVLLFGVGATMVARRRLARKR